MIPYKSKKDQIKLKRPSLYKLLNIFDKNFNIALFEEQNFELGKGSFGHCFLGKFLRTNEEN
jgi:hypothetical protein